MLQKLTVEQSITQYLSDLDAAYNSTDIAPKDLLAEAAIVALCRAMDHETTPDDIEALSAWATRLRLQGATEADVATIVEVIDFLRQRAS